MCAKTLKSSLQFRDWLNWLRKFRTSDHYAKKRFYNVALCNSRSKQPTPQFHVKLRERSSVKLMHVFVLWPGMTLKNPWFWLCLSLCYWINPSHAVTLSVQVLNFTSTDLYRFIQSLEQQCRFWVAFLVKRRRRVRCPSLYFLHLIFSRLKCCLGTTVAC